MKYALIRVYLFLLSLFHERIGKGRNAARETKRRLLNLCNLFANYAFRLCLSC